MAVKPFKKPVKAKRSIELGTGSLVTSTKHPRLQRSKSVVPFDCPIELLVEHGDNPNEQNEKTFDELVERIRTEGLDEPIMVYPEIKNGSPTQKFVIFSGHHRLKAAKTVGLKVVPIVIRQGWDEDRAAVELIARNQLHGNLNPHKFTKLYQKLEKRYSPEQLKRMMGFTEKKAFDNLFKQVRDQLPPKQKKKLDEAKETVKSVEDLSSVLNNIFENHGSELDNSLIVFSFGGKKHFYIEIDGATSKALEKFTEDNQDQGTLFAGKVFGKMISDPLFDNVIRSLRGNSDGIPSKTKTKTRKLRKPARSN